MPTQTTLFELSEIIPQGGERVLHKSTGEKLRDKGMSRAIKHANEVHESWSERAYEFLLQFIKTNKVFMCEDVRAASNRIVPDPPTKKAWGGIIRKAALSGFIKQIDYRKVKNPLAHSTPAAVWETV